MKKRYGMCRVEILIPDDEYEKIEEVAQSARVGVGPLIKAALRRVDRRQLDTIAGSLRSTT